MCVYFQVSALICASLRAVLVFIPPSCVMPTGKMLSFLSDYIPNNLRVFAGEKLLFSALRYAL